jgi:hypothetical protein
MCSTHFQSLLNFLNLPYLTVISHNLLLHNELELNRHNSKREALFSPELIFSEENNILMTIFSMMCCTQQLCFNSI